MVPAEPTDIEFRQAFEASIQDEIVPLIERLGFGDYWQRYQRLLADDTKNSDDLAAAQHDEVLSFLRHAVENVPFYRDAAAATGLTSADLGSDDLLRFPTIDKRTLQENFPDRLTSESSDKASWRYRSTSGTAFRIMSVTDYDARQWRYALHLRSLDIATSYRLGRPQVLIRTQACTEVCAAQNGEEAAFLGQSTLPVEREWPPLGLARLTLQETLLEPLEDQGAIAHERLDSYLDELERLSPYLLRGLPQYLLALARRVRRSGRRVPRIERILVQDSLPTAAMKAEIGDVFGCPVRESYGSSELGSLAAECEAGHLHIASSLFVVEVLKPNGHPAPVGEAGILAVTSMVNRAMPLVRYRLGDLGRLLPGSCSCGRTTPRLAIAGRVREALWIDGGFIAPRQIATALDTVPGCDQFQVVERPGRRLEILAVPSPGADLDLQALESALKAITDEAFAVKARKVRRIMAESSGKFALVRALERDFDPRESL